MKRIFLSIMLLSLIKAQPDMTVLFQYFDQSVDIYVDGDEIVISADGVPSHLSPYFPETYGDSQNGLYYFEDFDNDGINDWYMDPNTEMNVNPNQIGLQDYTFRIPLYPEINPNGPTDTFLGAIGVSLNGVPLYNEYEGPTAQLDPQTILSFDQAAGHPAPGGLYHYHFPPESLFVATEDNFIGFAADGFPVYGPKNIDGNNAQDLDDYHAEVGPTPDFPDGIYHYHTNYTSPYIIGAFAGAIGTGFGGGGGGGGGGGVPDCEDVPAGNPCCGDGVCGGPETEDNCPSDCGTASVAPELDNFSLSADSVNTSTTAVTVIYTLSASDPDDYLLDYMVRLILNGGPVNGGEIMESAGDFNSDLSASSVSGAFVFPIGTTQGQWNARVLLNDETNNLTNLGPDELAEKNFQNHIIVDNSLLGSEQLNTQPIEFSLLENYPNPFNPSTTIRFHVSIRTRINISVFDVLGNHVETIINNEVYPGTRSIVWAPVRSVVSGMYFVRLKSNHSTATQKVILLK